MAKYVLLDADTTTDAEEFRDEGDLVGGFHFDTELACTLFPQPAATFHRA